MNLIEEAESLLLHQFSNATKLKGLIRTLVTPFQEAQTELEKLHHGHYIDHAAGENLNVIGAIVGQPRAGMSDEDYRPWIKVAICLNNSAGTAENIFNIIGILYGRKEPAPIAIQEYPPNAVQFILDDPPFPRETMMAIIRRAVPVTTKCEFAFKRPASTSTDDTNEARDITINRMNTIKRPRPLQFDHTPFDESYFLDLVGGEVNHEQ